MDLWVNSEDADEMQHNAFHQGLHCLLILKQSSRTEKNRFLANSEDPDEMQHNAAFHQGLHCLLILKQSSGTEIHHTLVEIST